ncbi:ATP-binding protein [Candidatus Tisiphia endosymbiont of Nedyus quadrimaculatus]|uniref:ATP-binding protein n=1 Tax=Candidatus Tisiphia endosymbiont of Nedyus quadrimaculatus TaxID=3139332 RepID=UPI00345E38B5
MKIKNCVVVFRDLRCSRTKCTLRSSTLRLLALHNFDLRLSTLHLRVVYKKSRSLGYRLQLAKFPTIKLLSDTCQAKLVENIDIQKVIDNHQNIMFIGGSGSAKTHLAIGLAFTAIEKSYRVRFYTLNELASQLLNARIHNYESKFIDSVKRFHLIVVDELGYVYSMKINNCVVQDLRCSRTSVRCTPRLGHS